MKTSEDILTEVINELQPSANMSGEIGWDTCIVAMGEKAEINSTSFLWWLRNEDYLKSTYSESELYKMFLEHFTQTQSCGD